MLIFARQQPKVSCDILSFGVKVQNEVVPAAIMWKIQGSLCSPTEFLDQHIRVPYSNVRVGVKVRRLVEPFVRINRLLTVLASAELLNVHLQNAKKNQTRKEVSKFCQCPRLCTPRLRKLRPRNRRNLKESKNFRT